MEDRKGEVIIEAGAEGGTVTLLGIRAASGWSFRVSTDEGAVYDLLSKKDLEGVEFSEIDWVDSWESALTLLDNYPWHLLYPVRVHPDFKRQVWEALQKRGDANGHKDARHNVEQWSELCG